MSRFYLEAYGPCSDFLEEAYKKVYLDEDRPFKFHYSKLKYTRVEAFATFPSGCSDELKEALNGIHFEVKLEEDRVYLIDSSEKISPGVFSKELGFLRGKEIELIPGGLKGRFVVAHYKNKEPFWQYDLRTEDIESEEESDKENEEVTAPTFNILPNRIVESWVSQKSAYEDLLPQLNAMAMGMGLRVQLNDLLGKSLSDLQRQPTILVLGSNGSKRIHFLNGIFRMTVKHKSHYQQNYEHQYKQLEAANNQVLQSFDFNFDKTRVIAVGYNPRDPNVEYENEIHSFTDYYLSNQSDPSTLPAFVCPEMVECNPRKRSHDSNGTSLVMPIETKKSFSRIVYRYSPIYQLLLIYKSADQIRQSCFTPIKNVSDREEYLATLSKISGRIVQVCPDSPAAISLSAEIEQSCKHGYKLFTGAGTSEFRDRDWIRTKLHEIAVDDAFMHKVLKQVIVYLPSQLLQYGCQFISLSENIIDVNYTQFLDDLAICKKFVYFPHQKEDISCTDALLASQVLHRVVDERMELSIVCRELVCFTPDELDEYERLWTRAIEREQDMIAKGLRLVQGKADLQRDDINFASYGIEFWRNDINSLVAQTYLHFEPDSIGNDKYLLQSMDAKVYECLNDLERSIITHLYLTNTPAILSDYTRFVKSLYDLVDPHLDENNCLLDMSTFIQNLSIFANKMVVLVKDAWRFQECGPSIINWVQGMTNQFTNDLDVPTFVNYFWLSIKKSLDTTFEAKYREFFSASISILTFSTFDRKLWKISDFCIEKLIQDYSYHTIRNHILLTITVYVEQFLKQKPTPNEIMTWIQETMIKGDSDLFEKIQRSLQQWISHEGFHLLRHGQDLSKELFEKRSDFQLEELKALHANVSRLEDELYDFQNDIRNFLKNEPKGFHCDFRPSSSSPRLDNQNFLPEAPATAEEPDAVNHSPFKRSSRTKELVGTVCFYNARKLYGFIQHQDYPKNVYFQGHYNFRPRESEYQVGFSTFTTDDGKLRASIHWHKTVGPATKRQRNE